MKRIEILNMLDDGSILKLSPNYKDHYFEYCIQIEGLLYAVADDEKINVSSLDSFEKDGAFDNFVRSNDGTSASGRQKICGVLSNILAELKTWKKNYTLSNPDKVNNAVSVLMMQNRLNNKRRRSWKIAFWILIALFILLSAAVFVFSMLDAFKVFPEGTAMADACGKIAAACGALDFANGVAAIVIERLDDNKKKSDNIAVENAVSEEKPKVIIDKFNKNVGCFNTIINN